MRYLATNLKYLREQKGLKQSDLKAVMGFKSTTWNNYEKGVSKPGLDDLIKISKYFGYSESEILHKNLATRDSTPTKGGYRRTKAENDNPNIISEGGVEYKKLCEFKDKIIEENERIKAAQHRQIITLKSMVSHLEIKIKKHEQAKK